jgi:hypothetical protein
MKLQIAMRVFEAAMRRRANAWASRDQAAAVKADADCARLNAHLWQLKPPEPEQPVQGWRDWHSLAADFPWIKRATSSWLNNKD